MANNDIVPGFDDERAEGLGIGLGVVPGIERSLVLTLNGHLDTFSALSFGRKLKMATDLGFVRLAFDCAGLGGVSSIGIGSLFVVMKAVRPEGDIVLFNLHPRILDIFRLLGFADIFNVRDGLDDAVMFFCSVEGAGHGFPVGFPCPACAEGLRAPKPGRFRCPRCEAVLSVDSAGGFFLG